MEDQILGQALLEVVRKLRARGQSAQEVKALIDLSGLFKTLHLQPPATMISEASDRPATARAGGGRPRSSGAAAAGRREEATESAASKAGSRDTPPPTSPRAGEETRSRSERRRRRPPRKPGTATNHPSTMVEGPDEDLLDASREDPASHSKVFEAVTPKDAKTIGRLHLGTELGRGGMGRVIEAFDPELHRKVAVKLLLETAHVSKKRLSRFISEAQITAQLDHPNIVPVHELGATSTGEIFFVMKRVRGRSMRDIFLALNVGDRATQRDWSRRRLLQAFIQVCNALSYAHERGVIHRDLKPDNIMLGDFGEVYLMDWGVARVLGKPEERPTSTEIHRAMKPGTLDGATIGTPGYMSPEQGTGDLDALDGRSDVWSLGAILYEILTWQRAYHGVSAMALVVESSSSLPMDPRERAPGRSIPDEIADVCMKALSLEMKARYQDVMALAGAVEAFLEGSARKKAAARRLVEGRERWANYHALERETLELAACEEVLAAFYPAHVPLSEKQELLDVRYQRDVIEREREECFESVIAACEGALSHDPEHAPARALLAEVFWQRLLDAEARGETLVARQHAGRIRAYGTMRDLVVLRGTGALSLRTDPEGAAVRCQRVEQEGLLWSLSEPEALGVTPLERISLEMGSYLLTITAPDGSEILYPVYITRDRHWHSGRRPLPLFTREEIGEDFVYIPAGPTQYGGDPQALNSLPREDHWIGGFFMSRVPVTIEAYCEFINDVAEDDSKVAWGRAPRMKSSGGQFWDRPVEGEVITVPRVDRDGDLWDVRWPVSGVSWNDARSYTRWRSRRDGARYALPNEREWEKAARGVDGRVYPWGNHFDATLCKMRDSRPGRSNPEPVGSFGTDRSVYGVCDVAGGMRAWCMDPSFNNDPDRRVVRGGSWDDEAHGSRLAARLGVAPWEVSREIGFRLIRPLDVEDD